MSNSFNISVAPEIAALSALVTIVDTVVDSIRSADVPAIQANIDSNEAKIDAETAIITDIHDTDLPGVAADVTVIDTVVDAIKVKTDATPQNVRGKFYQAHLATTQGSYQDVVNVSGHGTLYKVTIGCMDAADTIRILLTLDGTAFSFLEYTGDTVLQNVLINLDGGLGSGLYLKTLSDVNSDTNLFNCEFESSLLVQIYRSAGSAGQVYCKVGYSIDTF